MSVFEDIFRGDGIVTGLSLIAGAAFVIAGISIFLATYVAPSFGQLISWAMMIGGYLGVIVFLAMYPALTRMNRSLGILAVVLGIFNFLYYAVNQTLGIFFDTSITPGALGLPSWLLPILYDYPLGLSILLIGVMTYRQEAIPGWFGVISVIAAAIVFVISPLGFFIFASIGLHSILLSAEGVWCLECVRRRFLSREREAIRERA